MLEVKTVETRTPIEIALDIDSEGMTTARKLYEFFRACATALCKVV